MDGLQGGKFWSGFASGVLISLAGSVMEYLGSSFKKIDENTGEITNFAQRNPELFKGLTYLSGGAAGGAGAELTGGNFWQGAATGFMVSGLNHGVHELSKPKTSVIGIYGAGSEQDSGNPALEKLVLKKGGKMFSSSFGTNDDEIIAYLKAEFENGKQLEIYAHSRGGAAAIRIANKLGALHVNISKITLYDPVGMYFGGSFNFDYPNVDEVTNYYQRNPFFKVLPLGGSPIWNTSNPFIGSPVTATFQWPAINNVNLTGKYYNGVLINHNNITEYATRSR